MPLYKNVNGQRVAMSAEEEAAVVAEREAAAAWRAANAYKLEREAAYPSVQEQFDMLWHELNTKGAIDKAGDWFTQVKAVKDAHPKPGA